ncbi:hypothetical protein J5A68_05200 [Prevotella melaninogenica]|uniref:hypothetical protein n=1 Tax=Prevotella melaninogenica TaxID=28132 RepID=UPI001BA5BEA9|nr:hypothetical protein [Prevotella melaninogenica]QUB67442.1 hypothetical protein J5A68_05200 [Prevotella melaninogenica]
MKPYKRANNIVSVPKREIYNIFFKHQHHWCGASAPLVRSISTIGAYLQNKA